MIEHEGLENLTRDYVRAGWTVTSRTPSAVALQKGDQQVRLYIDPTGAVAVDGPPLPAMVIDGRIRSSLLLLLILVAVFAVAWAVGFFR